MLFRSEIPLINSFASGKTIDERNFDAELYSLYLSKESRGLGIGRQLISAIARHFKEKGINSLIVWVMKQIKSGLGFYERMGGKDYIHRTSMFGGTIVDDVAYGWKDISALCMEWIFCIYTEKSVIVNVTKYY